MFDLTSLQVLRWVLKFQKKVKMLVLLLLSIIGLNVATTNYLEYVYTFTLKIFYHVHSTSTICQARSSLDRKRVEQHVRSPHRLVSQYGRFDIMEKYKWMDEQFD